MAEAPSVLERITLALEAELQNDAPAKQGSEVARAIAQSRPMIEELLKRKRSVKSIAQLLKDKAGLDHVAENTLRAYISQIKNSDVKNAPRRVRARRAAASGTPVKPPPAALPKASVDTNAARPRRDKLAEVERDAGGSTKKNFKPDLTGDL